MNCWKQDQKSPKEVCVFPLLCSLANQSIKIHPFTFFCYNQTTTGGSINVFLSPERKWNCHSFVSNSLWPHGLWPSKLFCPWDSPGKNTGVGYHSLPQGIFLTQGSNPCLFCLLHWQAGSLPLAHLGSPPCVLANLIKSNVWDFPGGPVDKNPPASAGDTCSVPDSGRFQMPTGN